MHSVMTEESVSTKRTVLQVRVSTNEKEIFEMAARKRGLSLSEWLRRLANEDALAFDNERLDAEAEERRRSDVRAAAFPQIPGVVRGSQVKGPDPKAKKYPGGGP